MKKAIKFLMVVVFVFVLASCGLGQKINCKTATVPIMLPVGLDEAFQSTAAEQIEWYLASSKDWTFSETRNHITAYRYSPEHAFAPCVRVTVFTQGLFDEGLIQLPDQVVASTEAAIPLWVHTPRGPLKYIMDSDLSYSSLTIQFDETFFVRFEEYSHDPDRNMTLEAINELFLLFANRDTQNAELWGNGSICHTEDVLEFEENKYGTHDISGYVHLDKRSACKIKVVDAVTKEVYYDQLTNDYSVFFVGWSEDPKEHFNFNQRLTIKKKPNGPESADVIIQLWAEDEDGSRCVLETAENITFWVR